MKVAIISDTHGTLPEIPPEADALIHCGDVGPDRYYDLAEKKWVDPIAWFRGPFSEWARAFGKPIHMTWGNHDQVGQDHPDPAFWRDVLPENVHLHVDEMVKLGGTPECPWEGRNVWFSPWSPTFGNWAWMAPEGELAKKYAAISRSCSVIVSHTPPYGFQDYLGNGDHVGSKALAAELENRLVSAVFCGHIHNGRGTSMMGNGRTQYTWIRNVAVLNEAYEPIPNAVTLYDWLRCWPVAEMRTP